MQAKTAILIFTLTAKEEAVRKRFLNTGDNKLNKLIAGNLIRQTVSTVKSSGLPYFIIGSKQQQGNSFGERLGNAFNNIFNAGFDNVIAIGNDCPELDSKNLKKARYFLDQGKVVIGPAKDGGVYLIGLTRESFRYESFIELKWKSHLLADDLKFHLNISGACFESLKEYYDIDSALDLTFYKFPLYINVSFTAIIKSILATSNKVQQTYNFFAKEINILNTFSLRGPPSYA